MKFPLYLAIIKAENEYYLLCDRDKTINAFKTQQDGLNYFESQYNDAHGRSYEMSMSACINYMFFQPSIVILNSEEELGDYFDGKDETDFVFMSHVSGGYYGAVINQEVGSRMFESGAKPSLAVKFGS